MFLLILYLPCLSLFLPSLYRSLCLFVYIIFFSVFSQVVTPLNLNRHLPHASTLPRTFFTYLITSFFVSSAKSIFSNTEKITKTGRNASTFFHFVSYARKRVINGRFEYSISDLVKISRFKIRRNEKISHARTQTHTHTKQAECYGRLGDVIA